MHKTGYGKIEKRNGNHADPVCQSCKAKATKRVKFEDNWGRLIVSLCDKCAEKDYYELLTQGRFSWPVKSEEVG